MGLTPSTMLPLGTPLPQFTLPDFDGRMVSSSTFAAARGLAVAFICHHCPYVRHMRNGLAQFACDYAGRGLAVVAIASNDIRAYPQDGPDGMREEATAAGYTFPYLFDESQDVARAFDAACTPDLYLFDGAGRLAYRGQFDGSRPGSGGPVTGADLRAAADAVLAGDPVPQPQHPSVGCNIKWRT